MDPRLSNAAPGSGATTAAARRRTPATPFRPTREQLVAAAGRSVDDVIAPGLRILFCGINPGLYSAAVGHHFARPGNRFWRVLHDSGLTTRRLSPFEERELLAVGLGITNLVARATASAVELDVAEVRRGARTLEAKVRRYRPGIVAVLGMSAYRTAFARPHAGIGRQPERLGAAMVWMLPNPSGLQARYQLPELVAQFRALGEAAAPPGGGGTGQLRPRAQPPTRATADSDAGHPHPA